MLESNENVTSEKIVSILALDYFLILYFFSFAKFRQNDLK